MQMDWGILAPEDLTSSRRLQGLGLIKAVRYFNDRTVPGIGRMWFPMPLVWSILSISIARELGKPPLTVANAVEALIMVKTNGRRPGTDPRWLGQEKLAGREVTSYKALSKRGVYVTQPLRMAMVQPLQALGFVTGNRYNAFSLTEVAEPILKTHEDERKSLLGWVKAETITAQDLNRIAPDATLLDAVRTRIIKQLREAGSPEDQERRNNLIKLYDSDKKITVNDLAGDENKLSISPQHFTDMKAGMALIDLRDAGVTVLDKIEAQLFAQRAKKEPPKLSPEDAAKSVLEELDGLREKNATAIKNANEEISLQFLREITGDDPAAILVNLAKRDGSAVRFRDDQIELSHAAEEQAVTNGGEEESEDQTEQDFPYQLPRLHSFYNLWAELSGKPNPGAPANIDAAVRL